MCFGWAATPSQASLADGKTLPMGGEGMDHVSMTIDGVGWGGVGCSAMQCNAVQWMQCDGVGWDEVGVGWNVCCTSSFSSHGQVFRSLTAVESRI